MLARKYFEVSVPKGLIVPADFQSMGFGIPAGIGAKLATPERHVVVVTGDGGFALCGMELSTAVREKVNITVILFNDNSMGLIRIHQLNKIGHSHAVKTSEIDYSKFCESIGVQYFKLDNNIHDVIKSSLHHDGVSLIEVVLKDTLDMQKASAKGFLRNLLKI
jgi:acetolactate synthase-1/2/3 large subunit